MKKILKLFLICLFAFFLNFEAFGQKSPVLQSSKSYDVNADTMFEYALFSLQKNKYKIIEIRSDGGNILFNATNKAYLLTVLKNGNGSFVKILPADSDFSSGFIISELIFKTIEAQIPQQVN